MDSFFGLDVVISYNLVLERKQVKKPKSKSKRIRKKWSKNKDNYALVDTGKMFQLGNTIIASPKAYEMLMKEIKTIPHNPFFY